MKNHLLKLSLSIIALIGLTVQSSAQCPNIVCPGNITVNSDSGICGAVVNYTAPIGVDTCNVSSQTYNYTGSMQVFTVPTGVTSINIDMTGASGGDLGTALGGKGGRVQGSLSVIPGTVINIFVGKQGTSSISSQNTDSITGGGGVFSYSSGGKSGTGGGASDIRIGGTGLNNRVVVAGGGGGAGGTTSQSLAGGNGGGLVGADGINWNTWPNAGGKGGTQTAGGAMGVACCSCPTYTTAGILGIGGFGSGDGAGGGGGGGGYYGGGGACFSGAGGGSSYTDSSVTNVIHTQGFQTGHGQVIISWTSSGISTTQIAGLSSGSLFPGGTTTNTFVVTSGSFSDTCSFTVYVGGGVDTSVTRNLSTFTANETGATYQWLNCDSNFMAISGATNQSYTATTNGSYAVVVSKNGCTDTSACQMINNVGIANVGFGNISIYPNPTNGLFTIDMGSYSEAVNYTVTSIDGRIVTKKSNVTDNKISIDLGNERKGIYLLKLHNDKSSSVFRITKL